MLIISTVSATELTTGFSESRHVGVQTIKTNCRFQLLDTNQKWQVEHGAMILTMNSSFFLVRCYFPNVSSLCETTSFFVQVLLLNVSQFKRDPTGKDDMKQPSGTNSGRVVRALALQWKHNILTGANCLVVWSLLACWIDILNLAHVRCDRMSALSAIFSFSIKSVLSRTDSH